MGSLEAGRVALALIVLAASAVYGADLLGLRTGCRDLGCHPPTSGGEPASWKAHGDICGDRGDAGALLPLSTDVYRSAPSPLISRLDVTAGSMNFVVPPTVDPTQYRSVVICCPAVLNAYAAAILTPSL